jgi:signal transduction histidine kinase/ligand-binding sensor domain-containing protein/DNA-binding response OmpR family regulator
MTLALNRVSAQPRYYFDRITTAQGLSQSTVKVIFQDSRGFMWFGTADGLNRYDGYEFRRFRHQANNPSSLCGNDIMALCEDRAGNIWIGTRSAGICWFDPKTEQFHPVRRSDTGEDLSRSDVSAFAQTSDSSLWIGTNTGLFTLRLSEKRLDRFSALKRQSISTLLADQQGNLWMGTHSGTVLFKQRGRSSISALPLPIRSPVNQHKWVTGIYEDTHHAVHVSTWGAGLYDWDKQTNTFRSSLFFETEFERRNLIKAIGQDKAGNLWLATDDGLVIAENGDLRKLRHLRSNILKPGELTTHALQSLYADSFGNVWIGTWEGGLNVYYAQAKRFNHLTQSDGLLSNRVTGVVTDGRSIVVATGKGISLIDRATNEMRPIAEGSDVTDLIYENGQLAALVWNQGADFYTLTNGMLRQTGQQRDKTNPYRALAFVPGGLVVANTAGQLCRMSSSTHRLEPILLPNPSPSFASATTLYRAQSGRWFIGSYNQGLWVYDPMTRILQPLGHRQSIGNEQILCIYEDAGHHLWIGTNGNGLFRYVPKTNGFVSYTTESGLPSDVVKSIVADHRGHLWIGTNEGLCRFDPKTGSWRTFTENEGLNNREFMPRAAFRDERGYLFFGGMQGVDYFHPDSLSETKQSPRVYLTGLRLLNKPVTATTDDTPLTEHIVTSAELRLTYRQAASITLEFVGLFFQKNQECRYAYRLDGFDPDWNYVGTQRNATYTNLPPGRYTFRVKASNADGVWTAQDARLTVVVRPPWYLTGWAFGFYAVLVLAGLWGYRRFVRQRERLKAELRFRQLEAEQAHELERLKTNFFTNVSHEFRTPLTLILDPVDQLLEGELPPGKVQESYRVIQQNGQRLLRLINQLLDLSKIEADRYRLHLERADVVAFLRQLVQSFAFQADRRHIGLTFRAETESILADFSPDALEKIGFNLIANAIKASRPDDRVTVTVRPLTAADQPAERLPGRLQLVVEDTGIGLSEKDQHMLFSRFFEASSGPGSLRTGTGIGLALTAELVKLHRGYIRFESQEGQGTTVTVELSVDAANFPADWMQAGTSAGVMPLAVPQPLPVSVPSVPPPPNRKQVLIVEDNDELRTYLHDQLSNRYAVITAENGKIGLDMALEHVPDLVVSDVIMPELDGIELSRSLKTDERTSHIPLILLTSRSSVESQLQGLSTGADDYQTKPFTFQVLAARIENLITQRQRLRERFSRGMRIEPAQITVNETDEQFLKNAIRLIEDHLSDSTFDVERLEQAMHLSQMQLYRKLTSLTGMSGNVFIRHIRLHRAKQLLEESNLTVAEIAYRVGFNSPSYFTRAYKKEFGVVPSGVAL